MSEAVNISAAAWRYAQALSDLAEESGSAEAVAADMQALREVLDAAPDFARFIASPLYGVERQVAVLQAVAEKLGLQDIVRRFLELLARNRRLALLPDVVAAWQRLQVERRGEVSVEAITATPLSGSQQKKLQAELKKSLGQAVEIRNSVDPDILGGLVLRIGSRMIDASVRQRLNALKGVLKGV